MNKICGRCNLDKPLSDFNKKKSGRLGVNWMCRNCQKLNGSKYYQDNKQRISQYRENSGEKHRQREWRKANQGVKNFHTAAYRAKLKQATPKWLNVDQLKEIKDLYKLARKLSIATGISHHVDHIMPLNGENLSGLHVPWNLQILDFRDNIRKSNSVGEEVIAGNTQCVPEELRSSTEKPSR